MTITEYLENLNRLKRLAVDRWGSLSTLERSVVDGSFDWLIENLEVKKGEIATDEDLSRVMDEFIQAVVDIVNSAPTYQSRISKFLGDLTTIQTNNKLFHKTAHNFNIETAGVTAVQKTIVDEVIQQYTGNGLNAHFAAPLKENVFRNILAGANMRDVKEVLNNYILGGQDKSGKLKSYLDQTAMMAVDSYTGAINQQLVNDFVFTGYIISGSLIETSSKQCIEAVDQSHDTSGYLKFSEWEKILDIARTNPKAKLIEGTTIKNLPLNKLHWGCRHDFTPMIVVEDIEKPKPKAKQEPLKVDTKPDPILQTKFKAARSKTEARQLIKDVIEGNLGLPVKSVTISSTLPLEDINARIAEIQRLSNAYKLSDASDKTYPVKIHMKSTSRYFGVVKHYGYGRQFTDINFGDQTDHIANRTRTNSKADYLRSKSPVDPANEKLAITTHEFAHVIAINQQGNFNIEVKKFFVELEEIRKEYFNDLNYFKSFGQDDKYSAIFLGKYASTNLNEFMAEGFTEYQLLSEPSLYAKKIGLLIDKYFKK